MHRAVCLVAACIAAAPLFLPAQAEARHYHRTAIHHVYSHHTYAYRSYSRHAYVHRGYSRHAYAYRGNGLQGFRQAWAMASPVGEERIVGSRPSGCPNRFCGCEASLYKFGRIIPELNLAANWRRFPRAAPAPGMAAVRPGHVMILETQVSGNIWTVHDGNSGGHVTREHAVSIAGYSIVNPNAASFAASSRFM